MSATHVFDRLSLPVIAAPMFLVSGPQLVISACRNGVIGAFPALNQRSSEGYAQWLREIETALASGPATGVAQVAPYAVNLIVHKSNERLEADLKITVAHRVPIVITSLGAVKNVVEAVHDYGGLVFHDVISIRHAQKALDAGVDGVIAVAAGAGGHGGTLNPFAFIHELRQLTDRTIILAGAVSTGAQVAAAIVAGADLVSIGTRFIGTRESLASDEYKNMLLRTTAADIVYTPKVSGVNANFMAESIRNSGLDLNADSSASLSVGSERKAWRDVWSAGHGVGAVRDLPPVDELIHRMRNEYRAAFGRGARYGEQARSAAEAIA